MGVMLSLDGTRQAGGRRRRGQHTRTADDQACLDALAAFLRSDALGAGRCLSKVPRATLAARLVPAARALCRAADLMLANGAQASTWECPDARRVELDFVLSPACLLGHCEGMTGGSRCDSASCQHYCHDTRVAAAAASIQGRSA
jgi:hypothetical protein